MRVDRSEIVFTIKMFLQIEACGVRLLNHQMEILNHKHPKYFIQIFNGIHVDRLAIVCNFMPNRRKW